MKRHLIKFSQKTGLFKILKKTYDIKNSTKLQIQYKLFKYFNYLPSPKIVHYEPTANCNLNCKMCYLSEKFKREKVRELDLDEIKHIFNKQLPKLKKISLLGGEPFLKKEIWDILGVLKQKNMTVNIGTNATLLTEKNMERLKQFNNIQLLGISIDGGTKEVHNAIRRAPFAFDRAIKAAKTLNKHFYVLITTVIVDENVDSLDKLIELAKELEIKVVFFELARRYSKKHINESAKALGMGRDKLPLTISENPSPAYSFETLKDTIRKIKEKGKELGVEVMFIPGHFEKIMENFHYRDLRKKHEVFCENLFRTRFDSQGNVYHCFAIRDYFGNLLDSSLKESWRSKKYKNFRKTLQKNNLLPICETCLYMRRAW